MSAEAASSVHDEQEITDLHDEAMPRSGHSFGGELDRGRSTRDSDTKVHSSNHAPDETDEWQEDRRKDHCMSPPPEPEHDDSFRAASPSSPDRGSESNDSSSHYDHGDRSSGSRCSSPDNTKDDDTIDDSAPMQAGHETTLPDR